MPIQYATDKYGNKYIPQDACVVPGVFHKHNDVPTKKHHHHNHGGHHHHRELIVTCPFSEGKFLDALTEYAEKYLAALDSSATAGSAGNYPSALLDGVNNYQLITGTLNDTSEQPSPYTYWSLTQKYGLREMWDKNHATFYSKDVKQIVSDYIKPYAVYSDNNGAAFVRCQLNDAAGNEHFVDIECAAITNDPEYVAEVLNSVYGFRVYGDLYEQFGRALDVIRLEGFPKEEPEEEPKQEEIEGVIIHQALNRHDIDILEQIKIKLIAKYGGDADKPLEDILWEIIKESNNDISGSTDGAETDQEGSGDGVEGGNREEDAGSEGNTTGGTEGDEGEPSDSSEGSGSGDEAGSEGSSEPGCNCGCDGCNGASGEEGSEDEVVFDPSEHPEIVIRKVMWSLPPVRFRSNDETEC